MVNVFSRSIYSTKYNDYSSLNVFRSSIIINTSTDTFCIPLVTLTLYFNIKNHCHMYKFIFIASLTPYKIRNLHLLKIYQKKIWLALIVRIIIKLRAKVSIIICLIYSFNIKLHNFLFKIVCTFPRTCKAIIIIVDVGGSFFGFFSILCLDRSNNCFYCSNIRINCYWFNGMCNAYN